MAWDKSRPWPSVSQAISRFMNTSSRANVHQTNVVLDAADKARSEVTETKPPTNSSRPESRMPGGPKGVPTFIDKKYLVWSGLYKTASDIPKQVEGDVIHRARSWGRIRMNIVFLLLTAAGGGLMVYLGKKAAARGESLEEQNLEWHRKNREEYERSKK